MARFRGTLALAVLSWICLLTAGCGGGAAERERETAAESAVPPPARIEPSEPDPRPRIVALGDSLTAGYGLPESESYPALLQARLDAEGYQFKVVNAGVSGDTSAGGLRRLDWALEGDVRVLIVALGANDGLRGLPVGEMQDNLTEIIRRARERNISVIVAGMEAPPNYGREYATAYREAFREIVRRERVVFIPFLLDKVAGQGGLNQGDGIHPNERGTEIVADTVWTALRPLLDQLTATS